MRILVSVLFYSVVLFYSPGCSSSSLNDVDVPPKDVASFLSSLEKEGGSALKGGALTSLRSTVEELINGTITDSAEIRATLKAKLDELAKTSPSIKGQQGKIIEETERYIAKAKLTNATTKLTTKTESLKSVTATLTTATEGLNTATPLTAMIKEIKEAAKEVAGVAETIMTAAKEMKAVIELGVTKETVQTAQLAAKEAKKIVEAAAEATVKTTIVVATRDGGEANEIRTAIPIIEKAIAATEEAMAAADIKLGT